MLERYDTDYLEHVIETLKRQGAIEVFSEIYKSPRPIVVETHLEEWDDPNLYCRYYKLHYRLTAVQNRNVVLAEMPPLTFVNHLGVVEWKCRSCGIINVIEATYCGEKHDRAIGCGAPREKTRQEMQ